MIILEQSSPYITCQTLEFSIFSYIKKENYRLPTQIIYASYAFVIDYSVLKHSEGILPAIKYVVRSHIEIAPEKQV